MTDNEDISKSLIFAVKNGDLQRTRELIDSYGLSYSPGWSEGYDLLVEALKNGHVAVAKLLLSSGSRVNIINEEENIGKNTPLHLAAEKNYIDVVEMLLNKGAKIDPKNCFGLTPLCCAIVKKNMKVTELLLNHGADINTRDFSDNSILHLAAEGGCLQMVEYLLNLPAKATSFKAYINCEKTKPWTKLGYTPLHMAVERHNIEVSLLLISKGADINFKAKDGLTPLHIAAFKGNKCIVENLLNHGACINSSTLNKCFTPLHMALVRHNEDVSLLLISKGADINFKAKDGLTPLHIAAFKGNKCIVENLLNHGACIDSSTLDKHYTPLHISVSEGDEEVSTLLISRGADINLKAKDDLPRRHIGAFISDIPYECYVRNLLGNSLSLDKRYTPLHIAVENGLKDISMLLISKGADINSKGENGITPLHIAVEKGHKDISMLLISKGADINSKGENDITPLHIAAMKGYVCIAEDLLNHGACIDSLTYKGYTPLQIAINSKSETVVKLLLQHITNIDSQDKDGQTILHLAVKSQSLTIVNDILKYCPDINNESNRISLKTAVFSCKEDCIGEALLEYGLTFNPEDANDPNLLHRAAEKGFLKIVEYLLKLGADVHTFPRSTVPSSKKTLLHSAVKERQEEVAKLLISYGADINAQDEDKKTPIYYACLVNADLNITKLLLSNKANVNPDLLNNAVVNDRIEIVKLLLQYDADIHATDYFKKTALHYTAFHADVVHLTREKPDFNVRGEIAKLLIAKGANIDAQDCIGQTPLHLSAREGSTPVTITLLNKGANICARDNNGLMPLHIAIVEFHTDLAKILIEYGACVDSKTNKGDSPLHLCAYSNHTELIEIILKVGADINCRDMKGRTPVYTAIVKENNEAFKILLEFGLDINIIKPSNHTPFDYAMTMAGKMVRMANIDEYFNNNHSLCESDDYYPGYSSYATEKFEAMAEVLQRHVIKLKSANLHVRDENLRSIGLLDFLSFQRECKKEIARTKRKMINLNFSFYDILTKATSSLEICMRSKIALKVLKSDYYEAKFPIYASMIKNKLRMSMERKKLLETSKTILNSLYPNLPYICMEKILSFQDEKDLKALIRAKSSKLLLSIL